jgi:pimeloyl-ACP methyl ester carboxylesterase
MKAQIIGMPADQFAVVAPQSAAMMVKNTDAQKLVAASALASDRTVFADAMAEDMTTDMRSEVATIKTPTLMLYPYDVTAVPDVTKIDGVYQTAYKSMPNVKLVRIDDSRHFIMYDQPAKLDEALEPFLK